MRHLSADELIDLAEGTRDAAAVPHLRSCEACRRQVDDLRAVIDVVAAAPEVPEPSPLFWTHFSNRVRGAVAHDAASSRVSPIRPWLPATILAAAAALVIVVATMSSTDRTQTPHAAPPVATIAAREPLGDIDDSLSLVADLSANLDFDDAREAGLAARGAAEHAVTHLNDGELLELRRLLEQQMGNP